MKQRLLLLLMCCLTTYGYGQVSVNFSSAADMNLFTQSPASNFSQSTTGGISSTGGVLLSTSTATTANYNATSFDLTGGGAHTVTMDFAKGSSAGLGSSTLFSLGFVGAITDQLGGGAIPAGDARVMLRLKRSSTNSYNFELGNIVSNASQTYTSVTPSFTLADTNTDWLRLSLQLTLIDSDTYSYTFSLYDLGAAGVTVPTLISSSTGTFDNATLAVDSSVYAGFRTDSNAYFLGGDNFTVVPEPATISLLLLGTALVSFRRLGRKRA